jgi:Protein of unknown function (DUF1592)/Protein of unknown function (DUF1588)/Protein of unknown function (DUF1595)/Protein of unknown function (DUF1587)/Protein of unknown function (DUF1585)
MIKQLLRSSNVLLAASFMVSLAVAGCTGSVGGTSGSDTTVGEGGNNANSGGGGVGAGAEPGRPPVTPLKFTCDVGQAPAEIPMRRLTRTQYANTVRDLLGVTFPASEKTQADAVWTALRPLLDAIPDDERKKADDDPHGSYRRLSQDVQQAHVVAYYNTAGAVGAALAAPARLPVLLGSCASGANTKACVDAFIGKFAERALRRPLAAEELTFFRGVYGDKTALDAESLADTIAVILNHPSFTFQMEHGTDAVGKTPGSFDLSPFERASRLSYHFWQTMPDESLLAAARSGALSKKDDYLAEVQRVFEDPRTVATVDTFASEWLKLEDVRVLKSAGQTPLEKAFAAQIVVSSDLGKHMVDEVSDLVRHLVWKTDGSIGDLLRTDASMAKTSDLQAIYGVGGVAATADTPVRLAVDERPGLFTRAAFLANGSTETRPVMKGVFLRKNVLCDELPAPPNNAANMMLSGDVSQMTTRERIVSLTESPGTNCAGCHRTVINPLGFATENFDALGRRRDEQIFFDTGGKELGRAPVDTRSVPMITDGDDTSAEGVADVMRLIAESGKPESCLARNYFRFANGRRDDTERDGCALEQLRMALGKGGTLKSMLREIALTASFTARTFE